MKRVLISLAAGVVLALLVGGYFICRPGGGGRTVLLPLAPREEYPAEEYDPVPVVEDRVTLRERLDPSYILTFEEEALADKDAGTEVIRVDGETEIYRTPESEYYVRQKKTGKRVKVEVARKPRPLADLEFEVAAIAATNFKTGTVGVGVHAVRLWRVHAGPFIGAELPGPELALGGDVAVDVYKNVEAAATATYVPATGEKTVSIGIGLAVR